jgi:hypothetical protein
MSDLKWHNEGLYLQRERIATAMLQGLISGRKHLTEQDTKYATNLAILIADELINKLNKEVQDD